MKQVGTIAPTDLSASGVILVVVRCDDAFAAIGRSLQSDGDLQIMLRRQDAGLLAEALWKAVWRIRVQSVFHPWLKTI